MSINKSQLENTQIVFHYCLTISIGDERKVHEHIPNFRIFKVAVPSAFFFPVPQQTNSQPRHPLSLVTPKFPLYSSHEYANCAFFLPAACDVSEGTDIVPINKKKEHLQRAVKRKKGCDKHGEGACQFRSFHPRTASL